MSIEGDRDLEELKKAIQSGDKERAESIAVTLFKERVMQGKGVKQLNDPLDSSVTTLIIIAVAVVGASVGMALLEWWEHKRQTKKREVATEVV